MKVEKDQILTSQFGGKFKVVNVYGLEDIVVSRILEMPTQHKMVDTGRESAYAEGKIVTCDVKSGVISHRYTDLIFTAIPTDDSQKVIELTDNLAVADETIEVLEDLLVKAAEEIKRLKSLNIMLEDFIRMPHPNPTNPVTPWRVGDFPQLGQPFQVMLNGEQRMGVVTSIGRVQGSQLDEYSIQFSAQVGDKAPRDY